MGCDGLHLFAECMLELSSNLVITLVRMCKGCLNDKFYLKIIEVCSRRHHTSGEGPWRENPKNMIWFDLWNKQVQCTHHPDMPCCSYQLEYAGQRVSQHP